MPENVKKCSQTHETFGKLIELRKVRQCYRETSFQLSLERFVIQSAHLPYERNFCILLYRSTNLTR